MKTLRYAALAVLSLGALSGLGAASVRPVAAQLAASPAPGITVNGSGVARVAPDRMHVEIFLNPGRGVSESALDTVGERVAATLRLHGLPDAAWILPLTGTIGQGTEPVIVGTIAKPTRPKLEALVRDNALVFPEPIPEIQNFRIQSSLAADDCSAAERRAQRLALDDARARADALARDAGLALGQVTAIFQFVGNNAGCASSQSGGRINYYTGDSAYGPLEIPVSVSLNVTFAVRSL